MCVFSNRPNGRGKRRQRRCIVDRRHIDSDRIGHRTVGCAVVDREAKRGVGCAVGVAHRVKRQLAGVNVGPRDHLI